MNNINLEDIRIQKGGATPNIYNGQFISRKGDVN